jgi:hypothetical protein
MRLKLAVCFAIVVSLLGRPVTARPRALQSVDRRVDELLSQMTIEEKVGQLNQLFYVKQFM